jgi:type VI secretion system secreted protein VgrG
MDAQATGPVTIDTPLGAGAATFRSMGGTESLSRPFVYDVEIVSDRADVEAAELLGQSVTVHLRAGDHEDLVRHWNGRVTAFEHVGDGADGLSRYRLTVRPWLWYLTQRADCRIFQNLRIPDILRQVFEGAGFGDFEAAFAGAYSVRDYVVQYRETDFDFVSRLMQREGIYYYFQHTDGKHTLVLADGPQAHEPTVGYERVTFAPPDGHRDAGQEYVRRWRANAETKPGQYAHADYDFTRPLASLYATSKASADDGDSDLEVYDYPGGFLTRGDGDAYARLRLEQLRRDAREWMGEGNARGLTVGNLFTLTDHPRDDQNKQYLVVSARYRLRGHEVRSHGEPEEEPFACEFRAIHSDVTFHSPRVTPKPRALGPQTARVVGPEGAEIWTDQYGRIKVQFFWDREGQNDERSSCWIRVAQAWAGSGWGAQFVPRIGHEVIVDFLEGDPDQPIVTGCVYNGTHMPAFALPNNQTQSGIKTRSTPGGTLVNGNEIRFEDMKGNEDLYVQAEKTQTTLIKDSQSIMIGTFRNLVVGAADSTTIGLVRSIQVGGDSATNIGADSSETIGGARRLSVGGQNVEVIGSGSSVDVGKDAVTHVGGITRFDLDDSLTIAAAGDENRTTGGKLAVRIGDTASYVYAAPTKTVIGHPDREATDSTFVYGTSSTVTSKDLVIQSDTSIILQCGDTKVVITPDGVTFGGKTLALNAGSKMTVASPNASLALDDNVTAIGKKVTASSSGAQLALDSNASLSGSKVQLGAGSGASASASSPSSSPPSSLKPVFVRTTVLRHGKPAAGVAYKLTVDGTLVLSGSTTGQGVVEQKVPATAASAELVLLDTNETRRLVFGTIEPPTTILGAQRRLMMLGYYHGPLDGELSPLTVHSLVTFQTVQGLEETGELDSATQSALKSAYGS